MHVHPEGPGTTWARPNYLLSMFIRLFAVKINIQVVNEDLTTVVDCGLRI